MTIVATAFGLEPASQIDQFAVLSVSEEIQF